MLEEQIEKIDSLIKPPAYNPEYKMWNQTTQRILKATFDMEIVKLFTSIHPSRVANTEEDFFNLYREELENKKRMLREILSEHKRLANTQLSLTEDDKSATEQTPRYISKKVFIVHGRDKARQETTARFLDKLKLEPIILHEQANEGRTIIEKFIDYSDVAFAVILLTADDRGALASDPFENQEKRARQNVILELGFFLGKLGRKHVCALYKEGVQLPSDYQGVLFVPIDKAGAWKMELARELKSAGLQVDMNDIV